jgi:hypothetical protein
VNSWVNEGRLDRLTRVVLGLFLMYLGAFTPVVVPWLFFIVGAIAFLTGVSGVCLLYRALHIDTRGESYHGRHAA